jgi:hypothetical protein
MSVKKLLGLENFSITEEEIMGKLEKAHRNRTQEVEFSSSEKNVKIKLKNVARSGMMKGYWDYYGDAK